MFDLRNRNFVIFLVVTSNAQVFLFIDYETENDSIRLGVSYDNLSNAIPVQYSSKYVVVIFTGHINTPLEYINGPMNASIVQYPWRSRGVKTSHSHSRKSKIISILILRATLLL